MPFNVNIQTQPKQDASDKIDLKSPTQNPHWEQSTGGGSRAGSINSTVAQRKHWPYSPEFWDALPTTLLTHIALEELNRRNRGSDEPSFPSPPTKPAQDLTLKEYQGLHRFSRHGGPDLCDLRGYSLPVGAMKPFLKSLPAQYLNPLHTTLQHTATTITSTHDANFRSHLALHNIHPTWQSREPDLENIYDALGARRLSLSPPQFSAQSFKAFQRSNMQAKNKRDLLEDVIPIIFGSRDANWPIARDIIFNHLEPLTDGTIPSRLWCTFCTA